MHQKTFEPSHRESGNGSELIERDHKHIRSCHEWLPTETDQQNYHMMERLNKDHELGTLK